MPHIIKTLIICAVIFCSLMSVHFLVIPYFFKRKERKIEEAAKRLLEEQLRPNTTDEVIRYIVGDADQRKLFLEFILMNKLYDAFLFAIQSTSDGSKIETITSRFGESNRPIENLFSLCYLGKYPMAREMKRVSMCALKDIDISWLMFQRHAANKQKSNRAILKANGIQRRNNPF